MTRQRLRTVGAFLAGVALLALALTVRNYGVSMPATPTSTAGCNSSSPQAALQFCVELLTALTAPEALAGGPGVLDQLPACGARTGMAPSFCVDLAAAGPAGTPRPPRATSGGGPCGSARTEAPIFCLGAVAAGGPEGRQAAITYLAERGGLNTRPLDIEGVHLQLDRLIGPGDAESLRSAVSLDLAAVEAYFGRTFSTPPTIFVLATPSGYADALRELLGYTGANAAALAVQSGGLYVSDPSVIFVNWSYRGSGPLLVMRHELTHVMLREVAGRDATMPAWIDEGLAILVQNTARRPSGAPSAGPAIALALLAQRRIALDDLDSLPQWLARNSAIGGYAYEVSETGIRELLRHVSLAVLLQVLAAQRSGSSFQDAYAQITGERYSAFLESFARKAAACSPAIAIGPLGSDGNLSYLASGFAPKRTVRMTISGAGYQLAFDIEADKYGLYAGTFGSTAPAGRYEIRASDGTASSPRVVMDTGAPRPGVVTTPDVCPN